MTPNARFRQAATDRQGSMRPSMPTTTTPSAADPVAAMPGTGGLTWIRGPSRLAVLRRKRVACPQR